MTLVKGAREAQRREALEMYQEEREKVRTLNAAIDLVRNIHRDAGESQGFTANGYGYIAHCCAECGSFGEYGEPWPCATIRALDGEAPS